MTFLVIFMLSFWLLCLIISSTCILHNSPALSIRRVHTFSPVSLFCHIKDIWLFCDCSIISGICDYLRIYMLFSYQWYMLSPWLLCPTMPTSLAHQPRIYSFLIMSLSHYVNYTFLYFLFLPCQEYMQWLPFTLSEHVVLMTFLSDPSLQGHMKSLWISFHSH